MDLERQTRRGRCATHGMVEASRQVLGSSFHSSSAPYVDGSRSVNRSSARSATRLSRRVEPGERASKGDALRHPVLGTSANR